MSKIATNIWTTRDCPNFAAETEFCTALLLVRLLVGNSEIREETAKAVMTATAAIERTMTMMSALKSHFPADSYFFDSLKFDLPRSRNAIIRKISPIKSTIPPTTLTAGTNVRMPPIR